MKKEKQLRAWLRQNLMKPRGVMTTVILLAVSVAVVAGVTLGWYDFLKKTQADDVVLNSEGQLVNVDGFTLFNSNEAESTLPNGNSLTLKSYDSVFGKNSETPVYILIPVSGEAVQQPDYDLKFTFDCGGSELVNADTNKIQPYFSNVAQVRYVVVSNPSDLTSYKAAREQFYTEDGSVQSGVSASEYFVKELEVDSNTHTLVSGKKENAVTLSAPGYSNTGVQYVLFELDYNFELVTGFVNNYADDFSGRLDQTQNLEFNDKDHQETLQITVSAD